MVGCAAVGCSNRSEKGFIMKYFPKDSQRRNEWAIKMKRANWTPTDRSVLCEVGIKRKSMIKITNCCVQYFRYIFLLRCGRK